VNLHVLGNTDYGTLDTVEVWRRAPRTLSAYAAATLWPSRKIPTRYPNPLSARLGRTWKELAVLLVRASSWKCY